MQNCGNCSSCGGCGQSLTITPGELEILQTLSQIPFLPIGRTIGDPSPVYLEEDIHTREEYTLILQCLEKKGLISLDFDQPLKNHTPSPGYPIHGSMALTAKGQYVLQLLELQGAEE